MLDSLTNVQMSSGQLPRHKVEMFKYSCVHLKGNYINSSRSLKYI